MDWNQLTPIGVFLTVLGGGIAWVIDRWQSRTDRREDRMIEMLKDQKAEAEKEAAEEKADRIRWERRAIAWYRQLLEAGIDPDPKWGASNEP